MLEGPGPGGGTDKTRKFSKSLPIQIVKKIERKNSLIEKLVQ